MENIVYDYNGIYYDDSSDFSSSSDSSDINFNTGMQYYPIMMHEQFDPFSIYKPPSFIKLSPPIKPPRNDIPVYFDLKDTFNSYNESMNTVTNNINKAINIYGGYHDDNEAKKYSGNEGLYSIPKVNTTPIKFKPIVLNSYLFPVEQETADMVNNMNNTIKIYDNKYKEILQYHNKYLSQSKIKYTELKNTEL